MHTVILGRAKPGRGEEDLVEWLIALSLAARDRFRRHPELRRFAKRIDGLDICDLQPEMFSLDCRFRVIGSHLFAEVQGRLALIHQSLEDLPVATLDCLSPACGH